MSAISSGSSSRRWMLLDATALLMNSSRVIRPLGSMWSVIWSIIGVSVVPGHRALAVIPFLPRMPSSSASALVRPITPCLEAA